jgi:hypothetical protein
LRRHCDSFERAKKVRGSDVAANVVLGHIYIVIGAVGPVDDVTLLGVRRGVSDVVVVHNDDVVFGDTALQHELVSVVNV